MTAQKLLDDNDLAVICKVQPSTVKRWRRKGRGPKVTWLSQNSPRYQQDDVESWLASRVA